MTALPSHGNLDSPSATGVDIGRAARRCNPFHLSNMRLKRFLLRYYPPGILLEYKSSKSGKTVVKAVNLFHLTHTSEADVRRCCC